jgi:hypothetical protein
VDSGDSRQLNMRLSTASQKRPETKDQPSQSKAGQSHTSDSGGGRWRMFTLDEIKEHHYKLDAFKWIRDDDADDPDDLREPTELISEAMEELQLALDGLADMQLLLDSDGGSV